MKKQNALEKGWSFGNADAVRLRPTEKAVNIAFTPDEFSHFLASLLAANGWIRSINHATREGKRRVVGLAFHKRGENQGFVIVHKGKLSRNGT